MTALFEFSGDQQLRMRTAVSSALRIGASQSLAANCEIDREFVGAEDFGRLAQTFG